MYVFNKLTSASDSAPRGRIDDLPDCSMESYSIAIDQVQTAFNLMQAIDSVSDRLLSPYSTESELVAYTASLEGVFIASGLNIPFTVITPSLEATSPNEIRERKRGFIKRIWDWIVEQVSALGKFIAAIFKRMSYIETKASDKLTKLKRYASEIGENATPDRKVPKGAKLYPSWGRDYSRVVEGTKKALTGLKEAENKIFDALQKLEKCELEKTGQLNQIQMFEYCGLKNGDRIELSPTASDSFSLKLQLNKGYAFSQEQPIELGSVTALSKRDITELVSLLEEIHEYQKAYAERFRSIDPEKLMSTLKSKFKEFENDIEDIWIHNKVSKEAVELEKTAKNGLQNIFRTHMQLSKSDVPKAIITVTYIGLNALHESLGCYRISNSSRKEISASKD